MESLSVGGRGAVEGNSRPPQSRPINPLDKLQNDTCMCANSKLFQQRGSPHLWTAPSIVPTRKLYHVR
jgi:hypothetical protein